MHLLIRIYIIVLLVIRMPHQFNFINMHEGRWQGSFFWDKDQYPMKIKEVNIQVNPPGTFSCKGSDEFGHFEMNGSFLMTFCFIEKKYAQNHYFNYIGEVFYPPQYLKNPLQPILKEESNTFWKKVKQIYKAFLNLQRKYVEKYQPIRQVMIRGIYENHQGKYGSIFSLTYVPNGSAQEYGKTSQPSQTLTKTPSKSTQVQGKTNESSQTVEKQKNEQVFQQLKKLSRELAYRAQIIQKNKK